MDARVYVLPIMALFIVAALFSAFIFMSPMHAEMGCPFTGSQPVICATNMLTHLNHWQLAFASILVELLLIVALALAYIQQWRLSFSPDPSFQRIHKRRHEPDRPTRIQELFSRGILNRKEPYNGVVS